MKNNDKKRPCFIYALTDPRTEEVFYVGQSVDPKFRFKAHIWEAESAHKYNVRSRKTEYMIGMFNVGVKPGMIILEECPWYLADYLEIEWMLVFLTLGHPMTNKLEHVHKDNLTLAKSFLTRSETYIGDFKKLPY